MRRGVSKTVVKNKIANLLETGGMRKKMRQDEKENNAMNLQIETAKFIAMATGMGNTMIDKDVRKLLKRRELKLCKCGVEFYPARAGHYNCPECWEKIREI